MAGMGGGERGGGSRIIQCLIRGCPLDLSEINAGLDFLFFAEQSSTLTETNKVAYVLLIQYDGVEHINHCHIVGLCLDFSRCFFATFQRRIEVACCGKNCA